MRKVSVETVDAVRRRVAVEIPGNEVAAEIERTYADLKNRAKVKGFRPGRVPRPVLERMFGDQVRGDVVNKLIQDSYLEALRDQKIEPVSQPEIVTDDAIADGALRYSATIEVRPEVTLANYRGLEAERVVPAVSDEDVNRFLEELRQSYAQIVPIPDRTVAAVGDVATVDYEASSGDRMLGRRQDRMIEVGGKEAPGQWGDRLAGCTLGEKLSFEITYPEDHAESEVAGKTIKFAVTLKAISRREVPELDDEFAKDHGDYETLDELRKTVRGHLESQVAQEAERGTRAQLVRKLVESHDVTVPAAMVERRRTAMVDEFMSRMGEQRPPANREEEVRTQLESRFEPQARDQVKAWLILEAIAIREGLSVTESELEQQVNALIEQASRSVSADRARAYYQDRNVRAGLQAQLLQDKALEFVAAQASVKAVEPSSVAEVS